MIWLHYFAENTQEVLLLLGKMTKQQALYAKVIPGKKHGYAIYGWDVFYPEPQFHPCRLRTR